jgi:hypothetical protein
VQKKEVDYEADDNAERLFESSGEFYITSIEENEDNDV